MTKLKPRATNAEVEKLIGQRVRQLRMQLGMSQEELGREVGVTFQQIQKYEKGTNRLSVSRMLQFAEILQTTPNDIIGWKTTKVPINGFNTHVFEAARHIVEFPEDVQIAVRRIADALTDVITPRKKR
jgi:transcriptional regulator with XRE-family HTH domain